MKISTKEYSQDSQMFSPSFQDLKEIIQANFKERISHPIFVGEFEKISWEKNGYVGEFEGISWEKSGL